MNIMGFTSISPGPFLKIFTDPAKAALYNVLHVLNFQLNSLTLTLSEDRDPIDSPSAGRQRSCHPLLEDSDLVCC